MNTILAYTAVNTYKATVSQATTKLEVTTEPTTVTQQTTGIPTTDIAPGEGCPEITVEIDGSIHNFPATEFGITVSSNVTCDNGLSG